MGTAGAALALGPDAATAHGSLQTKVSPRRPASCLHVQSRLGAGGVEESPSLSRGNFRDKRKEPGAPGQPIICLGEHISAESCSLLSHQPAHCECVLCLLRIWAGTHMGGQEGFQLQRKLGRVEGPSVGKPHALLLPHSWSFFGRRPGDRLTVPV